jgi:hypothetical protein
MSTSKSAKRPTATKQSRTRKKTLREDLALSTSNPKPRQLHLPAGKLLRFKRVRHPGRLPSVWRLSQKTLAVLASRWRLFVGIALVYALLSILLVRGFSAGADVNSLKQQLGLGLSGNAGQLVTGLSVFTALIASSGNSSDPAAGTYQVFLWLIASLAIIWAVRQTMAGKRIKIRDAFYKGMYPLIPFVLVLVIIMLQTIPLLLGGSLYALVTATGIAIYANEKILWAILCLILAWTSVYMLCSSVFAMYIVTLPDMTPRKALRSARDLVRYRRAPVLRKVLFMPIAIGIAILLLTLPSIFFAPAFAPWFFFALATFSLVVFHAYMYVLYKELLA